MSGAADRRATGFLLFFLVFWFFGARTDLRTSWRAGSGPLGGLKVFPLMKVKPDGDVSFSAILS
jgi:hypothetical protein